MNHLWQSTVFAGLAGVLTLALRKNSARVRYWLWLAASMKFLVPFSLFVAMGSQVHLRSAPAVPAYVPMVFEQIAEPLPSSGEFASTAAVKQTDWLPILLSIWACGFILIAIRWAREWLRMRTILRRAKPLHLPIPVRTMSSHALLEPGVFGVFRPVLLLPEGIADRLTPAEFRAILIHELCHVRRRDNLFAATHMFTEAIFWFHPLLWWIGRRLVEERERACDEEVLRQGSEPEAYAEGILKVCELYLQSPLTCVAGVSGANLKRRIEDIMHHRILLKLGAARKSMLAAAALLAVAVPIAIGILNVPSIRAQSAPAPKFEVASIRPCTTANGPSRRWTTPGSLHVTCLPLEELMVGAYAIYGDAQAAPVSRDISGGPDWVRSDRYNIEAKTSGTPDKRTLMGAMLQGLLEDRFKLKIHRETREIPEYALTVAKGGLKLKQTGDGGCIAPDQNGKLARPFRPGVMPSCGMFFTGTGSGVKVEMNGVSLDLFARDLHDFLDRPVSDQTGVAGTFNIHLEYKPGSEKPGPQGGGSFRAGDGPDIPPPDGPSDPAPSIFAAFQEQLGLKLDGTKGPGEFIFIDSVERPSEN